MKSTRHMVLKYVHLCAGFVRFSKKSYFQKLISGETPNQSRPFMVRVNKTYGQRLNYRSENWDLIDKMIKY